VREVNGLKRVIDEVTERQDPASGGATRMVAMNGFDHLLNWKLRVGSHPFPGQDGGTCINEAALVAAGFEYRPIHLVEQMPQCFSRPICRLAMELNDNADDRERQRLLPYVTRLACADTRQIEAARAAYIRRRIGPYGFAYAGHDFYAGMALPQYDNLAFDKGLEALEGALAIGRQADPLGPEEVQIRMDAARAGPSKRPRTATPTPAPDKPLLSTVKSWLTVKVMEPTL
jgi:hypothetical protein